MSIDCSVDLIADIEIFLMNDGITGLKCLFIDPSQSNGMSDSVSFISCSLRKELYSPTSPLAGIKIALDSCVVTLDNVKNEFTSFKYTRHFLSACLLFISCSSWATVLKFVLLISKKVFLLSRILFQWRYPISKREIEDNPNITNEISIYLTKFYYSVVLNLM